VLENGRMEELKREVSFSFWEKKDESHTVVRFATSWSTTDEDLDKLEALI
jgi:threonine aldolase